MENNKNKKSVKFQGDMLNFCDFIQVYVFTRNHHLKCDLSFIEKERFGKLGHYGCLVLPAYFKTLVMMNAYFLNKFFCAYCRAANESDLQYCLFDVYF